MDWNQHVSDMWHVTNQAYLGITDQLFKFNLHFCVCFVTVCKMAEKIQPQSCKVTLNVLYTQYRNTAQFLKSLAIANFHLCQPKICTGLGYFSRHSDFVMAVGRPQLWAPEVTFFFSPKRLIQTWGPPSQQKVPGTLSPGAKRSGREVDHSRPSRADVKLPTCFQRCIEV